MFLQLLHGMQLIRLKPSGACSNTAIREISQDCACRFCAVICIVIPSYLQMCRLIHLQCCRQMSKYANMQMERCQNPKHLHPLQLLRKAHLLSHCVLDLEENVGRPCVNPCACTTWRDEDFIGKIMPITKALHSRSIGVRTVLYYIARLQHELQKYSNDNI